MQHAADRVERFEPHNSFGAIVSDLLSLVEHVQVSINPIERAIARKVTVGDHDNSNVIMLDDVTPQYLKASSALNNCSNNPGNAMQFLLDAGVHAQRPVLLWTGG